MKILTAYLATLAFFATVDTLWLGVVAKGFYQAELGALRAAEIRLGAAVLFYLVYAAGIVVFAVLPAVRADSLATALLMGGLFGFFAYATYDLTNLATLRDWPVRMSIVDIAWGTALTAVTAVVGSYSARLLTV
jgi:uncharacterized membrane protein